MLIKKFPYRAEIDGLRALAVIVVVLGHSGLACRGGFIGVDVFFVISGFLITSLVWKDIERDRFQILTFWERRARRIAPAVYVLTFATLIAGWLILLPNDLKELGDSAAALSVFMANMYFWHEINYFTGNAELIPLLHTWSLAVEEQFYFIAPLVLVGIAARPRYRCRKVLLSVLGFAFFASLFLSLYTIRNSPSATFYFLPTRAWELLLGGLIAFSPSPRRLKTPKVLRELLSFGGIGFIFAAAFLYRPEMQFPGLAALLPCLGTAMFIWSDMREEDESLTLTGGIMRWRPLVFVGLISYSWYLWHWPFLAYARYLEVEPRTTAEIVGLVAAGFGCAVLSWRYVERPFRKQSLGTTRNRMFVWASVGLLAILLLGIVYSAGDGWASRVPGNIEKFSKAEHEMSFIEECSEADLRAGRPVPLGDASGALSLFVWGDSHAMALNPAIDALLREKGLSGAAATASSTAPVRGWYGVYNYGLNQNAISWNEAAFEYIRDHKIPVVLLHSIWSSYARSPDRNGVSFEQALEETVRSLLAIGSTPYLVLDVPGHSFHVPHVLSRYAVYGKDISSHCAKPSAMSRYDGISEASISKLRKMGAIILDPKPEFLDPERGFYVVEKDGLVLYRDVAHLTTRGAIHMLKPFLEERLSFNVETGRDD